MRSLLLPILATAVPLAAADHWVVDPARSSVVFHCSTTWHDFDGVATIHSGQLLLDGAASAGAVEVEVASMDTKNDGRTATMKDEVLSVASFPTVRFTLERFDTAPGGGTAHGRWAMHGVTRPITIPVAIAGGRATATFPLAITGWDIEPPSVVVNSMSETVVVVLDLALSATTGPAPARERGPAATGVRITDATGASSDLGTVAGRTVILYDEDGAKAAAAWAAALGPRLAQPPVGILRAQGLSDRARTKALARGPTGSRIDAGDRVRPHLALPTREVVVAVLDADGHVAALSDVPVTDGERDRLAPAR